MAVYRIREPLSAIDLKQRGRHEYISYVKRLMVRDLAEKMLEAFGDMPIKSDKLTGEQYLEFTMNAWENWEVEKAKHRAWKEGFERATHDERQRWEMLVAELKKKLEEMESK